MISQFKDDEQVDLLSGFVEEGREMLEEVEPQLVELEQDSTRHGDVDPELINAIFRLFHSLKGSAGYLGLQTINQVTHQAETLLDLFRKQVAHLESQHIDLLIRTCDFMRQLLDQVETKHHDSGFEAEAEKVIANLQAAIVSLQSPDTPRSTKTSKKSKSKNASAQKIALETSPPPQETPEPTLDLAITPELIQQFAAESYELIELAENSLLNLEKNPSDSDLISQAFRALHSFKGNSGLFGFSDLEKLSHQAETALENIKEGTLPPTSEAFSLLLEIMDVLRGTLAKFTSGGEPCIPGLAGWLSLLQELTEGTSGALGLGDGTLSAVFDEAEVLKNMASASEEKKEIEHPDSVLVNLEAMTGAAVPAFLSEPEAHEDRRTGEDRRLGADRRQKEAAATQQRQSVRVDVEKLDILLDLVGELVIAEAMVAQNPDLKGMQHTLDRFERSVMHLEKISRDLQDVVTSIRMIPLSGTFRRMIRLVRDLSQKAGKKVELVILGEETEVDKTVIEQINDPLVHLIRNSIDHGGETPEERRAAGKSEIATITLEAKYVGSEVWIFVKDDGRGLNRGKILSKALEKGLIADEGAALSDEAVWQIVFQPGFSTAEKVTDVSGRGVGMDVVKRNIEGLRGKIDVRSKAGQGTTIILRLPLTLAIIDGMLIRVGRERYILPIASIRETLKPRYQDVTRLMDGQEILNIRGALLPVVRLHETFNLRSDFVDLTEGLIILVENEGKSLCLFVDELIGQQQIVIKGLSRYIGELPGISGCTILGDGDISLIIDVAGIFNVAQRQGCHSSPPAQPATRFQESYA